MSTGKPDDAERVMSGLERGRRKSTERQLADVLLYLMSGLQRGRRKNTVRQLADVLLYRTPGSVGEVPGNRHLYPTSRPWIDASASRQSPSGSGSLRYRGAKSAYVPDHRNRQKFATGPVRRAPLRW